MRAYILSIGDELVTGLTTNTNSGWLAEQLTALGIITAAHITVADDLTPIVSAIRNSLETLKHEGDGNGGVLLISGGLGPTEDDLTRQALANALNEQLVEEPEAVLEIENWFRARGRIMSPSNRTQALRPSSATCIENRAGTAPGLHASRNGIDIFVMPGVPHEMKDMFTRSVLPTLQKHSGDTVTLVTRLNTFGAGESQIGEQIKDLMARGRNPSVGTTAHEGSVSVRIYATGLRAEAQRMTQEVAAILRKRLGTLIFGENDVTLQAAIAQLLKQSKYTLATAESCTGGLVAKMLTDIPGSSAYFLRGWVTYSNQAKHDDLSVPEPLIEAHGAVSQEVARAMAEGARKFAQSDFALAITGIAGPDGATTDKPLGTVWIALAGPDPGRSADGASGEATIARKFIFAGDRGFVRLRTAQMALAILRWKLLGVSAPG